LNLDGQTIVLPKIVDPSELRTDVTGKVVRYLHDNGAMVEAGAPYIEVEAMKMIMTMKATESGKITHALSPGTVIAAGDLLASLELKDPSKVKKIENYNGKLDIANVPVDVEAQEMVKSILSGYNNDPNAVAQNAFAEAGDAEAIMNLVTSTLTEFVRVEKIFDGKVLDDVVRDLTKTEAKNLGAAVADIRAHQKLGLRVELVLSMLRQVADFRERFNVDTLPESLLGALSQLTTLEDKVYGDLKLISDAIIQDANQKPFDERVEELRDQLRSGDADLEKLSTNEAISVGIDLLTYLFSDQDETVQANALELYIRKVHRSHRLLGVTVEPIDGRLTCSWTYQHREEPLATGVIRKGVLVVVPDLSKLSQDLPAIIQAAGDQMDPKKQKLKSLVNHLYIATGSSNQEVDVSAIEKVVDGQKAALAGRGIVRVNFLQPMDKQHPGYYTFPASKDYKECSAMRGMRPTFYWLLELSRLEENFNLERLQSVGKNVQVYLGTEKTETPVRGGPPQVVFVRGISHTPGIETLKGAERSLVLGLDELERAQASSKVDSVKSSSRIFLQASQPIDGKTPEELSEKFKEIIGTLKSRYAERLVKLRVDEIEILLRLNTAEKGVVKRVRFLSSSVSGEWLKTSGYTEEIDAETGERYDNCIIGDGDDDFCLLDHYGLSSTVQTKRSVARNAGSTYAYDFLGLLEVGLLGQWNSYLKSLPLSTKKKLGDVPPNYFAAKELVAGKDGELELMSRPIGSNKVGMVAWLVTMKTPEYPEGRDVVLIANDVTVKSGSFSVDEDEVYYKASEYARKHELPRLYISCNAGARIGEFRQCTNDLFFVLRQLVVINISPRFYMFCSFINQDFTKTSSRNSSSSSWTNPNPPRALSTYISRQRTMLHFRRELSTLTR